ncbi:hypothetical protein NLG97_g7706 [Lecanicillium saksenae]|uniref:Uncharacterized protein n=1 Tax=Lecanicillium saksenae TaxID=468837 RepID=A0ACC1QL18_9HYPO|nr:hypothetical protein NLG97_g7706 [Lecanicillium saksenae]
MSRIFLTGGTGYIGGEVLRRLSNALQTSQITVLARNQSGAARITASYPDVVPLVASLDDTDSIQKAASDADVILHLASSNHVASAEAISHGIGKTTRSDPVWIQISGASVLAGPEIAKNSYGNASSKVYSDVDDVSELHNIIANSPKRVVDRIVTQLHTTVPRVRTAIIYGPMIYGHGTGPVNQRSIQVPSLARSTLQHGYSPVVGKGLAAWSHVHVSDIAELILKLVTAAQQKDGEKPLWNADGIYFAEAGKMPFIEISRKLAAFAAAKGLIASASVKEVDPENADSITPHGAVLLGTNAQTIAGRARDFLDWNPQGPSLDEALEAAILDEAASAGKTAGRAKH